MSVRARFSSEGAEAKMSWLTHRGNDGVRDTCAFRGLFQCEGATYHFSGQCALLRVEFRDGHAPKTADASGS